jgi:hypothetical protein
MGFLFRAGRFRREPGFGVLFIAFGQGPARPAAPEAIAVVAARTLQVEAEKLEADKAPIAVTIACHNTSPRKASDSLIRYELVHESGSWKIDDIRAQALAKSGRSALCSQTAKAPR